VRLTTSCKIITTILAVVVVIKVAAALTALPIPWLLLKKVA
jgi:hypothetical protein